ncbi:MAG: amino acid permease [Gemmatimonadaceae bacterium]
MAIPITKLNASDDATSPTELPRTLGLWSATAVVVGITIGSGIFRSPAGIANRLPGPGPLFAVWIMGGVLALCGALTLAEIAGALPRTGGFYVYLREGWGRLPAFLFGWSELVIIRAAALGALATTFAEYLFRLLGYDVGIAPYDTYVHYAAAATIAVIGIINILGVRLISALINVTTIAKFGAILFILIAAIAIGLANGGAAHFTPVAPVGSFSVGAFGLALVSVLWVYDGWGDLTFAAGEVKDPRRNLPRALIFGTLGVIAIYMMANVAYLAVLPIAEMRVSKLVAADVAQKLVGGWGVVLVSLTVVLSTFGSLSASMLTNPRTFFAMADDGLLFKKIASVHPRYETPWVAIALAAALGIAFVLLRTFEQLADTFVTAILPFYALGVAAIFTLRRRPNWDPPFRCPGYPLVPLLFVLATVYLLANSLWDPTSRLPTLAVMGVIVLGIPVYYVAESRSRR